mmetsp:Transcript_15506/g.27393  ORF Transcript_15506/g.27393 Transcript_15506/m.27393 type:complete len:299 (-) Transcript_15506:350-1246(-)
MKRHNQFHARQQRHVQVGKQKRDTLGHGEGELWDIDHAGPGTSTEKAEAAACEEESSCAEKLLHRAIEFFELVIQRYCQQLDGKDQKNMPGSSQGSNQEPDSSQGSSQDPLRSIQQVKSAINYVGFLHATAGRHETAMQVYSNGLELFPHYPNFHYNVACINAELGKKDRMLESLERALASFCGQRQSFLKARDNSGRTDASLTFLEGFDKQKEMNPSKPNDERRMMGAENEEECSTAHSPNSSHRHMLQGSSRKLTNPCKDLSFLPYWSDQDFITLMEKYQVDEYGGTFLTEHDGRV